MNGPKDDSLRDPDVKTAFFMPRLATNKDGVITLEFDVPNVNTTWQFCALAYTENLKSAYINETVTANKPIMVQANLPRFIRNGDRVKLLATVMNNSLDSINANVEITIFDPAKNKIIKACPTTVALAPKASDIVETEVGEEITKAYTGIGYRVKAQAGKATPTANRRLSLSFRQQRKLSKRNRSISRRMSNQSQRNCQRLKTALLL